MTRMIRTTVLLALGVAAAWATTLLLAQSAHAQAGVNCSNFATQTAAQDYYESVGGPGQDPAGLDADHDGIACESLPCPCRSLSPDTDGDGWVDQFDACPTVAARTANGCPLPPPPPPPPPPMDVTPPNTTITAHPSGSTTSTGASFSFTSTEAGSTFTCTLDGVGAACTSPTTYSGLAVGSHTFTVAARDAAGNSDPTPASFTWTIRTAPDCIYRNQRDLPDSSCTPGAAFRLATVRRICRPGYTKTVRKVTKSTKEVVYAEYGVVAPRSGEYEIDHLVPLELGGSNAFENLWPQPASTSNGHGFRVKDRLENRLHTRVCSGRMTLRAAQRAIRTNWVHAFKRFMQK
jgi:Excalibur calcium-binding domain